MNFEGNATTNWTATPADTRTELQSGTKASNKPIDEAGEKLVMGVIGFASTAPARCKLQILSRREERLVARAVPQEMLAQPAALPVVPIRRLGHLALVHSAE